MFQDRPVLVKQGKETIHIVRNVFEVRRRVGSYVDGLFTVTSAELCDIGNGGVIQCPKSVLVEGFDSFSKPISMQLESKSYCRRRFCSCIFS